MAESPDDVAVDVECAVCLRAKVTVVSTTVCGHAFCRRCLDEWRDHAQNGNCPSCRAPLPETRTFKEACDLAVAGDTEEGVAKFREVIKQCTQAPWAAPHYNLGLLLTKQGDLAGAEQAFRRSAELRRDDADTALNWGKALMCLGRNGEAIAAFQRAQRLRPTCPEASRLLARFQQSQLRSHSSGLARAQPAGGHLRPAWRGIRAMTPLQVSLLRANRQSGGRGGLPEAPQQAARPTRVGALPPMQGVQA